MPEETNYGFNIELERLHAEDTDWLFGAASQPCRALIPAEKRLKYLPVGEVQRGTEDFQDCATRSPLNILELKFNYLLGEGLLTKAEIDWLTKKKYLNKGRITFSNRFNAMLSGTTRFGNSLKAPVDSVHRYGLIPEVMLPQSDTMSWNEYHDTTKITTEMTALGKEFLKYFPINYEKVYLADYPDIIKQDEIGVAGYAWPWPNDDGTYPAQPGKPFNHAYAYVLEPAFVIYDNYIDQHDGDFIKKLAPDYILMEYGYRVYIGTRLEELPQPLTSQKMIAYLKLLLSQGKWQMVLDICKALGRAIGMKV